MNTNLKIIVASDLHGSADFTKLLIKRFVDENADKLILLGDLYYHGPRNALPNGYNTMECANLLNSIKDRIIAVKGNCDAEVDQMISEFKFIPHYELTIANKKAFFSHGHLYNKTNHPKQNFDIMFYGHEHVGYIIQHGDKTFINTGSVSLPKNNSPHSYVLIDGNTITLKNLESKKEIAQKELHGK